METEDEFGENPTLPGTGDNYDHKELPRGTSIDRYLIVEPIGSGGMGTVYRAYDPQLNRGVALKIMSVMHADLGTAERAKARLIREAQALAQLSHPNVVAVHDAGTFENDVFIAMELVEGKTLDEWIRDEKRTVKEILEVMIAAGRGLSAAHKAGLIHRDFKPGNVIVGDDERVRVLDFGLACAADQQESIDDRPTASEQDEQNQETKNLLDYKEFSSGSSPNLLQSPLTHAGGVLGTPLYMAPEQHLGWKTDERTDQFGFCVVLYEVLYGKRPFAGRSREELKREVSRQQVSVPSTETDVPNWIWKIIRKGLSIKPEGRYQTIDSLLDDLDKDPEIARAKRRKKLQSAILILLLVAITLGFGYYALFKGSKVCTGAERKVAGVWSDERKEKISQAFAKTGLSYANDSFVRVERRLGEYLHRWKSEYTETCEATRLRDEQPVEIMVLKMRCLDKRLNSAGALVKVLGEADKIVVARSVQAVSSLSEFSKCNDVEALQSRIPPPKDKKTKNKVAAIRNKLAEVEAFEKTGKYREGLELVRKIMMAAKAVDYQPLIAEVFYELGSLLNKNGEYKKAETTLFDAAEAAGESRDGLLVAKTMALLSRIVGEKQARNDVGLSIARDAELMLLVAGGNATIRFGLLNTQGVLFYRKGCYDKALEYLRKSLTIRENTLGNESYYLASSFGNMGLVFSEQDNYDKAVKYYRKALVIHEQTLGPKHPEVATSLNNLGLVLTDQGDYDKALEYHSKALAIKEKALGPNHPRVAKSLNNLGLVLQKVGQYKKALEHYRKALAIEEKVLGIEHSGLAWSLSDIGSVLLEQGRPKQAMAPLERVVRLCEKKGCDPEPHGSSLFHLAQALNSAGGDKAQAIKLAKQALGIFKMNPKRFTKELNEVNVWLEKHPKEKPTAKAAATR